MFRRNTYLLLIDVQKLSLMTLIIPILNTFTEGSVFSLALVFLLNFMVSTSVIWLYLRQLLPLVLPILKPDFSPC